MALFRRGSVKTSDVIMPIGLAGIKTEIDGQALRRKLTHIAEAENGDRNLVKEALQNELEVAKSLAVEMFERGRLNGLEMARRISAIHDEILTALYDYAVHHVVRAPNPTTAERMAICAVGGYGRAEMAPFSDLDLLFVLADKKGSSFTESVTEYVLYMLWDLGLKVGHSTRTTEQCITLAKEDQTILTALLDLRFIAGDKDLSLIHI